MTCVRGNGGGTCQHICCQQICWLCYDVGMTRIDDMPRKLVKAGANWVDGERFFDRETEIQGLTERVGDRNHTLLTAQRRMGKTSLVRELLRRLDEDGDFATVFVDLEAANDAADAIAEIAIQSKGLASVWDRTLTSFANRLGNVINRIEEVGLSELKVKLRAAIDAGNWQLSGDQVFEALASCDKPVVLAIDELPILVNRLLQGHDYQFTPQRRQTADEFMSWLRKNAQAHRNSITLIVSGSIGLEPVLRKAGLSAQANIFAPFDLKPWSAETSIDCLDALARTYGIDLPEDVRREMCSRLGWCVPHHVQQFFDHLHEHLRSSGKNVATVEDVELVYERDLLSVRGQIDLEHYEGRLRMVLGDGLYRLALEMLTEAAINDDGVLTNGDLKLYRDALPTSDAVEGDPIGDVLYLLEHDGYLERRAEGYVFLSRLLEDWWRARHGQYFTPIADRQSATNAMS